MVKSALVYYDKILMTVWVSCYLDVMKSSSKTLKRVLSRFTGLDKQKF